MGMIYLNNEDISVPNLIEKSLGNNENSQFLKGMISDLNLEKMMNSMKEHEIVESTLVGRTSMVLSLIKKASDKKTFI
jgi:hypothetical protein